MIPAAIASIGLVLNMAGVALVFFFGYPQPSHETGVGLGLEDGTVLANGKTIAEHNTDVEKRKKRFLFMSRLALTLMFAGFLLQFIAIWLAVL
jgi:hypothetical protein